jgi:hypothetical protein
MQQKRFMKAEKPAQRLCGTHIAHKLQGHHGSLVETHLMCPANQIHVMLLQETRHDIWTKSKRYSSIVF